LFGGGYYRRYHLGRISAIGLLSAVLVLINSLAVNAAVPEPISLQGSPLFTQPRLLAVTGVPPSGAIPTDVTPSPLGQEREYVTPGPVFRLFQRLPSRLWFSSVTEVTQRLETNVFFTSRNPKRDYVFRVLPNVILGYNVRDNTSVYCNYFVIKDVYADHSVLTFPTTQSLSLGLRQNFSLPKRFGLQLDFQSRELWQTSHLHQADLLPGVTLTYVPWAQTVMFGNVQLQLRGREYFVAPTREIDPFYSVGVLHRRGQWTFSAVDTFVTNFRSPPFHGSIPTQGNVSMIADFEVARTVNKKHPALQWFVRAEPIWNWDSKRTPGLSGFDFRLFGGLRLSLEKPSLAYSVNRLRQQLMESEGIKEDNSKSRP